MRLPGGIRTRIAITLAGIVAGALAVAYVIVVPSLERQFVDTKLDELQELAGPLSQELPDNRFRWPEAVDSFAAAANARVVAYDVLSRNPPTLAIVADSRRRSSEDVQTDPIALRSAASSSLERGRVGTEPDDYASVAIPVEGDAILLFQASLGDSLATVHLVERRFLIAAAFALALVLALGLTAASMLTNRIRRLETAAERIADGDFGAPIVDHGDDELGQLAVAFDRMRVRLAQLDNARKEFVANASHELRTPLFSLGGFLELLTDEELDEETRMGFLQAMQGQVERLAKLSTDLLDLSRVDAGQFIVAAEAVDLAEVSRALVAELEHVASGSGHTLETEAGDAVWSVADEDRVLQVGRALVVNALVHTPPGSRVLLTARKRGARGELAVEDDGPGIPDRHRHAVFERFYRIEGGKASGSGLGLAIARELARLMGGIVRLESRPGRTVFTLDLPGGTPPTRGRMAVPAFSRENGESGSGAER